MIHVNVLALRGSAGLLSIGESLIFSLDLVRPESLDISTFKYTGWERNVAGNMAPNTVNLGSVMDPVRLVMQLLHLFH